ncbi:5-nitroimidazole resistance protein NimA [Centipeda periodontii DSM 2778]|uniref:5-nitroimidazole resistance protein NimA n=1 Tax=Centipeda periodontii DSM 2778 TaxID=888060 RepID=F5RJA6_9FIRM|nr:pyridoxamine 5'-phosphate oxidase family protein [Centipeda periodontii]EGK62092.1 5-nitroimidazole resistance protein NimA [Centipeda periodontii DSM 2778]
MFHKMRRNVQQLSQEESEAVLLRGTAGVLALMGDKAFPYAVPISYVYDGEHIYFHSATEGHKIDAIQRNPNASFAVIDRDEVIPEKYTTAFRSVIVFGSIRIIGDDAEKLAAIRKLALKYAPDNTEQQHAAEIDGAWSRFCMLEMSIAHMTGKQAIELVAKRR